jgi:NitT/TauT family transport system permease protein
MARPTATTQTQRKVPIPTARRRPKVGAAGEPSQLLVVVLQIAVAAVVLGAWEAIVRLGYAEPLIFSSPLRIALRMVEMLGGEVIYGRTIYDHLGATLQQIGIGYAVGASAGIVGGYLLGRSRLALSIIEPYILALFSIPKIALAPLFIVVLGIGLWSRVGIVFIEVFFVVFFNVLKGVLDVNREYINIARIMGASRSQLSRRVILPAALPSILLGLKVGVPFAMIGAVLGEYIASNHGIGWLILYSSNSFDASGVWASILFLVIITWTLSRIAAFVEARVLRWQPQRRGRSVAVA